MAFEVIILNLLGKSELKTLNGRKYLVVSGTSIVPGVLNGSMGALYYPPEEIARNFKSWDETAITMFHPTENGYPASAKSLEVLKRHGIGFLKNSRIGEGGKLQHDLWFDVEYTKNADKRFGTNLYSRLEKGEAVELSTGLFTENEKHRGSFNKKTYEYIARNYRPDHLAILPNQVGACSIRDGCGVLVNTETEPSSEQKRSIWRRIGEALGILNSEKACPICDPPAEEDVGEPDTTLNALAPGVQRHADRGQFLPRGSGTGKGEPHAAAKTGFGKVCSICGGALDDAGYCPVCPEDDPVTLEAIDMKPTLASLNVFCPTGQGGGVDPSCGVGGGGSSEPKKGVGGRGGGKSVVRTVQTTIDVRRDGADSVITSKGTPLSTKKQRKSKESTSTLKHSSVEEYDDEGDSIVVTKTTSLRQDDDSESDGPKRTRNNSNHLSIGVQDMTREQLIAKLATNCSCDKDKTTLNELSTEMLKTMVSKDMAANVLVEVSKDFDLPPTLAINEMPAALKKAMEGKKAKAGKAPDDEEEDDEEEPPATNKGKKGKATTMNYEQWISLAPPEVQAKQRERDSLADFMLNEKKQELVNKLVANVSDPAKKAKLSASLLQKPLSDLAERVEMLPPAPAQNRRTNNGGQQFDDLQDVQVNNDSTFFSGLTLSGLNGVQVDNSGGSGGEDGEGEGLPLLNVEWDNPFEAVKK